MEWLALLAASKIVPLFPRIACFYLAQFLGWWISIWNLPSRRVAFSNLEAAFGDQYSRAERATIVRQIVSESGAFHDRSLVESAADAKKLFALHRGGEPGTFPARHRRNAAAAFLPFRITGILNG